MISKKKHMEEITQRDILAYGITLKLETLKSYKKLSWRMMATQTYKELYILHKIKKQVDIHKLYKRWIPNG